MLKRLITTHRPTLNLGCGIVDIEEEWSLLHAYFFDQATKSTEIPLL